MTNATGLRVGVVGCGYWGSKHIRVLHSLESVATIAVIDPNPDRALQLSRNYPALEAYKNLDEALPHVDAVIIATPPSTHKPLALKAIAAGRHVMVEKPLATNAADAREMIAAAEARGVVLMVGHTFEYHSAVWQLREMVQKRELGDLYYLDTARLNLGLYQNDCNVLFDLAPHDVSILNFVLGATPVSVQCWSSHHAHQLEDVGYLRLHYKDPDITANVHVSWLDPCKVRRVTMVGSQKMVIFNDLESEERIKIHDKGVSQAPQLGEDLTQPPMSYRYGDVVSPHLVMNEPLLVEDEHFADCVLSGMVPLTGGANGLAVVEVLEAAQLSAAQGREVLLEEVRGSKVVLAEPAMAPQATAVLSNGSAPIGDLR
ncbi:Gfo/Idh/MocA family oxidoreductase [Kribbella sp. NPDC023855]|uniref:Gfo/Idh/MocA family protein n=1 Tax=Kribbella sp. NPDC023855 TaxID=3154698 RepID=UPI0033D8CE23